MENGDPGSAGEPPGAAKGPRDVELPPWSKGRYGTAVGRAVHGVLQAIDLASGEGLDQLVAAQCAAERVVPYADIVREASGKDHAEAVHLIDQRPGPAVAGQGARYLVPQGVEGVPRLGSIGGSRSSVEYSTMERWSRVSWT